MPERQRGSSTTWQLNNVAPQLTLRKGQCHLKAVCEVDAVTKHSPSALTPRATEHLQARLKNGIPGACWMRVGGKEDASGVRATLRVKGMGSGNSDRVSPSETGGMSWHSKAKRQSVRTICVRGTGRVAEMIGGGGDSA
jgi:hypothetical protein